jgi:hypothetical protein
VYAELVPKLWTETIEEHRRAVQDATLDTTAALVAEHGLASVTMPRTPGRCGDNCSRSASVGPARREYWDNDGRWRPAGPRPSPAKREGNLKWVTP